MVVIGLSGGFDPHYGYLDPRSRFRLNLPETNGHDSAAALVRDGELVAAIEEERLVRVKHTNFRPSQAVKACLEIAGLTLKDVDRFAYYSSEPEIERLAAHLRALSQQAGIDHTGLASAASLIAATLGVDLGPDFDPAKLVFVDHHLCHATSAYVSSGFRDSLVVTLDGVGNGVSCTAYLARANVPMEQLASVDYKTSGSLGMLYAEVTDVLGFSPFGEYKVMGLAPYGDPAPYREALSSLYTLLPEGQFSVSFEHLPVLRRVVTGVRGQPQEDTVRQDIAAALQEAAEKIAFHFIAHFRQVALAHGDVGRRLCLAGGVGHNCSINGKLLRSGLFDEIFVQPASHDAGCALGAAQHVDREACRAAGAESFAAMNHLYLGKHVGNDGEIEAVLSGWTPLVSYTRRDDIYHDAAALLADGAVIGWVQGRSEFGPRALGNRSIIADPRPAGNKDRINSMVKKREGFRPFAPAVLQERAAEFFDVPQGAALPFMTYVVPVKPQAQQRLGAVTHVDGTARVQTVSRGTNPQFWQLIQAFSDRTGTPVLLNTSFNNNAEPIVDSVADALRCFVTTGLTHLVIGNYLIDKRAVFPQACVSVMSVSLPGHIQLAQRFTPVNASQLEGTAQCINIANQRSMEISPQAFGHITNARHDRAGDACPQLAEELFALWAARMIELQPLAPSSIA